MEFKELITWKTIFSPEPHLRSFIPETSNQESETPPIFEDIEPEDKKDKTLSTVLFLLGLLLYYSDWLLFYN